MSERPPRARATWPLALGSIVLVAVGAVLLWPRTDGADTTPSTPTAVPAEPATSVSTPATSSSTPETEEPAPSQTTTDEPDHHHEDAPATYEVLVWDATAQELAVTGAEALIDAWFSRLPDAEWINELAPLMTQNGGAIYAGVNPELIRPGERSGAGQVRGEPSGYYVEVTVPTTAGEYVVAMVRDSSGAPWLAERLYQPTSQEESSP